MRRTKNKTVPESRALKRSLKQKKQQEHFSKEFDSSVGQANCCICPPFQHENSRGRKNGKHGKTKPKYKNKRA